MKTAMFVDTSNLYYCVNKKFGRKIDYEKLVMFAQEYITDTDFLYAFSVRREQEARNFVKSLEKIGFITRFIKSNNKKPTNLNADICIEAFKKHSKIDSIILCSADRDIAPLIRWAEDQGINVTVYACGIPMELKEVANSNIEINEKVLMNAVNESADTTTAQLSSDMPSNVPGQESVTDIKDATKSPEESMDRPSEP